MADTVYEIKTFNLDDYNDTVLYLYDSALNLLDYNDQSGSTNASRLIWQAPTSDDYFIRVVHYWGDYGTGTQYDVTVAETDEEPFRQDEYEPDNSSLEASTLTIGDVQRHNFHTYIDEDWIRFSAEVETYYDLKTFNLGFNNDTILYLYDSQLNYIAYDDDSGPGVASRLIWQAPASDDYFIKVVHYWGGHVEKELNTM